MSTSTSSILTPVGVAVATTLAINLTFGPRLAARSTRIQGWHADRDAFKSHVMTILAASFAVEGWVIPDDAAVSDELRKRVAAERKRSIRRIDESTCWLYDNTMRFALGYATKIIREATVGRYATTVRAVWLSDRTEDDRVRIVGELSKLVHATLIAHRRRLRPVLLAKTASQLLVRLDELNKPVPQPTT